MKSTKPNEIANGFCHYFSAVVSTLKQTLYPLIDFIWRKPLNLPLRTYKSFHFGYVSVIKVTQLFKKLKRKKAGGNYNLPPGLLIDLAAVICAPLTHVNLFFRSGVFPSDRKIAKILSLYKNDATDQFGNYRPISILPTISKVVEKIVHNRLADYLSGQTVIDASIWFSCEKVH